MGGSSRITWPYGHGEGRVDFIIGNILWGKLSQFGGGGGGGGVELFGGEVSPAPPSLDETLATGWPIEMNIDQPVCSPTNP